MGELERIIELGARKLAGTGSILVLVDADDDLACVLGPSLQARAARARPDLLSAVVVANREKESWFLASIESLAGRRGIPADVQAPEAPDAIRGAKERIAGCMDRPYSEVTDQPALAALFDLDLARSRSPSFDKLVREFLRLVPEAPGE